MQRVAYGFLGDDFIQRDYILTSPRTTNGNLYEILQLFISLFMKIYG